MPLKVREPRNVLAIPNFRRFLVSRLFIILAIQMTSVNVGWQIYELTRDPLALGLIGLAEALAFFAVALFGGHFADTYDRQRIMSLASAALTLCAGSLMILSWHGGSLLNRTTIPIYGVIVLTGIIRGFLAPATMALSAQIVPRRLYANMAAVNSLTFQIGAVAGPAMAGLIYGFWGVKAAYGASLAMGVVGSLAASSIGSYGRPDVNKNEPMMSSLTFGVRFVFGSKVILPAMSLDMFAVLFGGATAVLPMVADTILHVGPKGLGFLRTAPAVGAVLMSLNLSRRPPLKNAGRKLLWAVAGYGLCMAVFALSRNFWLSLLALAASGAADNISVVIRQTILQLFTPDEMRGRVSAVNSIFIGSSNEIGAFESGLAAKLLGLVPSLLFNSAMTMVVTGTVALLAPTLRKLDLTTAQRPFQNFGKEKQDGRDDEG